MSISIYSNEFIDATTQYYETVIRKASSYLMDTTLLHVWRQTRCNVKHAQLDTRMLLWYLANDGSSPEPVFENVYTDCCVGCDKEHALDSQFHIGSECHEVYKQRSIVLHWALYIFPWNNPDNYVDTEQKQNFYFHVEMLKTFCTGPIYADGNHEHLEQMTSVDTACDSKKHIYTINVPKQCKSGDEIEIEIPHFTQSYSTFPLIVPDGVSSGGTFDIVFNTDTQHIDEIRTKKNKGVRESINKKRKYETNHDYVPTKEHQHQHQPLRRSKRIRNQQTSTLTIDDVIRGC